MSTVRTNLRRSLRTTLLTVLAVPVLVLGVGAGAAQASTITTPGGPISVTENQTVAVSGTATPGNVVTLAVCNETLGGLNGTHCDGTNFVAPITVSAAGTWSTTITVHRTFTNVDLSGGSSSGTTVCSAAGVQCQIQTSEYASWPPTGGPVGVDGVDVNF